MNEKKPQLVMIHNGKFRLADYRQTDIVVLPYSAVEKHLQPHVYEPLDLTLVGSAYLGPRAMSFEGLDEKLIPMGRIQLRNKNLSHAHQRAITHALELAQKQNVPYFGIVSLVLSESSAKPENLDQDHDGDLSRIMRSYAHKSYKQTGHNADLKEVSYKRKLPRIVETVILHPTVQLYVPR